MYIVSADADDARVARKTSIGHAYAGKVGAERIAGFFHDDQPGNVGYTVIILRRSQDDPLRKLVYLAYGENGEEGRFIAAHNLETRLARYIFIGQIV